jgi:hypothetical protein
MSVGAGSIWEDASVRGESPDSTFEMSASQLDQQLHIPPLALRVKPNLRDHQQQQQPPDFKREELVRGPSARSPHTPDNLKRLSLVHSSPSRFAHNLNRQGGRLDLSVVAAAHETENAMDAKSALVHRLECAASSGQWALEFHDEQQHLLAAAAHEQASTVGLGLGLGLTMDNGLGSSVLPTTTCGGYG